MSEEAAKPRHFIQQIIDEDNRSGKWGVGPDGRPRVHTRFPPEPNGYLHIGHAKSINLNYGLAAEFGGRFNLRFDDTNPVKEEQEYVDSIVADVRWLGARWDGMDENCLDPAIGGPVVGGPTVGGPASDRSFAHTGPSQGIDRSETGPTNATAGVLFASDYFQPMYDYAMELVKKGHAYVCDLTAEQTRDYRGTLIKPGRNSPFRDRTIAENVDLFERMRRGEFADGSRTLRAKIDMASPNLNLRDPVMYRILHAEHHRTGNAWCIYPMYDWAHGIEDSIEGITHSICTLEFENHRPLYDWFIRAINEGRTPDGRAEPRSPGAAPASAAANASPASWGPRIHHPQQIEFARLNLNYTVMSKRKLLHLVKNNLVNGWDDPRMPTLSGLRRRGYTPEAIREFCQRIGIAKFNGVSEIQLLESCVRDHLNKTAPRAMAVLRPVRIVIENWAALGDPARVEWLDAVNNPEDATAGTRKVPFSGELFIEADDFMETPPPKYWRLHPGNEVRLRWAYFVRCTGVTKHADGSIREIRCTYDPATRGGDAPDGRKVKSTIHWVSAAHALPAEVRLYDRLFKSENPEDAAADGSADPETAGGGRAVDTAWLSNINPDSLQVVRALLEPGVAAARPQARYQFERHGYFCVDTDSQPGALVFNRTVSLKDSWARAKAK